MAKRQRIPRLLCYDIADPGRLARVHRIVTEHALLVQYSVYYLHAHAGEIDALFQHLRAVIDPREDDIRVYPLPEGEPAEVLGRQAQEELLLAGAALPDGFGIDHGVQET